MALTGLAASAPERSDPPTVNIEIGGESLRFRRPGVADLQPPRELMERIGANSAGIRPDQAYLCYLLGACYRADPSEGKVEPWKLFVEIARRNDLLFAELCAKWDEAFPEFVSWIGARAEAKNGSRAALEDSDTEQPTSPPDSEEPLPSSEI